MNPTLPINSKQLNLSTSFRVEMEGMQDFYKLGQRLEWLLNNFIRAGWEPFGDWVGMIRYCKSLPAVMHRYLEMANRVVGLMYYHDVQAAWETQVFIGQWAPLNSQYLAWKISQGLDRRTLIASGDALKELGVQVPQRLMILVGTSAEANGEPYMVTQEFGSKDGVIPPRPLFGPTLEANLNRYAATYIRFIDAAFLSKPLPAVVNA